MRVTHEPKTNVGKLLLVMLPCLALCFIIVFTIVLTPTKPVNMPVPPGWKATSQAEIDKENRALSMLSWEVSEASPVKLFGFSSIDSDSFYKSIEVYEINASTISKEVTDFVYFTVYKPEEDLPDGYSRDDAERYASALPELIKKYMTLEFEGNNDTGKYMHLVYTKPEFSVEQMDYGGYAVLESCLLTIQIEGEPEKKQLGDILTVFHDNHVYVILLIGLTTGDTIEDNQEIIDFLRENLSFN